MPSARPLEEQQPLPAGHAKRIADGRNALPWRSVCAAILLIVCIYVVAPFRSGAGEAAQPQTENATTIAGNRVALQRLAELCVESKRAFRSLTSEDLAAARRSLEAAVARLDRRLSAAGAEGQRWRNYLRLDELQRELARTTPDPAVLTAIHGRFAAGHEGLGLIWFRDVRVALMHYLQTAAGINNPDMPAQFEQLMLDLAQRLKQYAVRPTAEDALAIGQAVGWLDSAGQTPELLGAIRQALMHPNLAFQADAKIVAAGLEEPVDDIRPVRDFILGTDLYSTAHTTGGTIVELVPDEHRAVLDALFYGTAVSEGIGYNGPVCIYNTSVSHLAARKRIWMNAEGLHAFDAVSRAETNTTITDIRSRRGRSLVECLAWRQALRKKPAAEYIAARHAEARLNDQIDRRAAEAIAEANRQFQEKFRQPLLQRRLFPQQLRFGTDRQRLQLIALQAEANQVAAQSPPPPVPPQAEMALCIHESLVNNFAGSALAGMTVTQESFNAGIGKLMGEVPERLRDDDAEEPWAIGFAAALPITVAFADNQIHVSIRGRRFIKGGEAYPGMDVTAVYKIVGDRDGFRAVRQGPLVILPPGATAEEAVKLTSRQVVIKTLLEKRFGRILAEELPIEGFQLPGKWEKLGRLEVTCLEARDGWLVIGWRCASARQVARSALPGR